MNPERKHGVVKAWGDRGFGFIQVTFKERYFFHINEFCRDTYPEIGERVSFEVAPPRKEGARPCAVNVQPVPANGQGGGK